MLNMSRVEKTVFISYRRTNMPWARAIFQDLTQHGYDVFLDYTGVASGDFESVILENIHSRAHFLVLLTPSALERCGDASDWLRREIEAALDSQRNIVPLTLEGFDFGTPTIASQLTGKLAALRQYNAMSVPPEYFDAAMAKLRDKFLNVPLDAVLHPASLAARQAATQQKGAAAKAPRVEEDELTAQQWFERGVNATDHDEEIRFNTEAIRLKPDYAEAFYNRALARDAKGDLEGAIADYNEAIHLKPDFADAFNNRGNARRAKGDVEGALEDYDEAIRLKPDDAMGFYNRGLARCDKGDLAGAIEDYSQAIRLKPDYADAFCGRGFARYEKGDLAGAIEDQNQAIQFKPDYALAFNNRGIARRAKGDVEGALEDYDEAIRLQPDYAEAFYNRGLARHHAGDLEGALEDYNQAIRLKPDDAEAFNNRGVARRAEGDLEGALHDYNEALRLQPDHALALSNRELVLKAIADRSKG
jgi:tetratricopeptide (TPR) repeat protein